MDEAELIMKLTMAVVGDEAGARRSAAEISKAIDEVVTEEIAKLESRARAGDSIGELNEALTRLQQVVAKWASTADIGNVRDVALAAGTRATTAKGVPVSDQTVKAAARKNLEQLGNVDIGTTLRQMLADASQRLGPIAARAADANEAANEMVEAMRTRANILERLAGAERGNLADYPRQIARVKSAQARIDAAVQERLLADREYIQAQVRGNVARTRANAQIQAQTQARLAREQDYIQSLASTAKSQQTIKNQVQARLTQDEQYIKALAGARILQERQNANVLTRLAASDRYSNELARAAAAQAQINASKQQLLANTPGYAQSLAQAKSAQAQVNAAQQQILSQTPGYAQSLAQARAAQAQINAATQVLLVNYPGYADSLAQAKLAQAQVNASVQALLAQTPAYAQTLAQAKASQAQVNAAIQSQLAQMPGYTQSLAQAKAAQAEINAGTQALLAQMPSYAQSLAAAKVSQATINTEQQRLLVANASYTATLAQGRNFQAQLNNNVLRQQINTGLAQIQAEGKVLQQQLNTQQQRLLSNNQQYLDSVAEAKLLQQRINNEVLSRQLSNGYVQAQAAGRVLQEQLNARIRQELAVRGQYAQALADRQIADRQIRGQTNQAINQNLNDPIGALSFQMDERSAAERRAREAKLRAADDEYIRHQAESAAAKKFEAAQSREKQLADANYIKAVNLEAANSIEAARIKSIANLAAQRQGAGAIAITAERDGIIAARQRAATEFQRVAELRELLGLTQAHSGIVAAEVKEALEGKNLRDVYNKILAEKIVLEEQAIAAGLMPGRQPKQPKGPGGGATGLGLAGSFRTTLRYGISGALLYGAASGIGEAIREATELDRILNQIRRQMTSQIGDGTFTEEARGQFQALRDEIFDIAQTTGIAADQVADVAFQLQGAFGANTQRTIRETRDAIIAAQVTGLEVGEVIDSFTALTQSFEDTNLGIKEVSDTALLLQEDLGVLAKETITFAADLAPVGAELGFTVDQLAAIGAVAQQTSGRTGATLAEAFGRVFPAIQGNAAQLIDIFDTMGEGASDAIIAAFRRNDIGAVFDELLKNYNRLGSQAQGQLIEVLGGRREAQSIIGVLKNGEQVFREYDNAQNAAGKTAEYFSDLQKTLQVRVAQLGEEFKRFVQLLFESGLKDFFIDFLDILGAVVRALETVAQLLSGVGKNLGPIDDIAGVALQGALLYRGAIGIGRGYRALRNRGAAEGAEGAAGAAAAVGFRARLQAGRDAGQSYGRAFMGSMREGAAGALPALLGVGATIGASYMFNLDSSVRSGAEQAARRLHDRGGITDYEIGKVFQGYTDDFIFDDRTLTRKDIRSMLTDGGHSVASLIDMFSKKVVRDASAWDQALEGLPGEASKKIADDQARIAEVIRTVAGELFKGFDRGIDLMSSDQSWKEQVEEKAAEAFDFRPLRRDIAQNWRNILENQATLAGSDMLGTIQANAQSMDMPSSVQDAITRLIHRQGITTRLGDIRDRDLVDAVLGDKWLDQAKGLRERYERALRDNTLPDFLRDLEGEIDRGELDLPQEIVTQINALRELISNKGRALNRVNRAADNALLSLDEALAGFEAGTVTAAEVENVRRRAIANLRAVGSKASLTEAMKLEAELRQAVFDRLNDQIDSMTSFSDLQGTGSVPNKAILKLIESQIGSDQFSISQDADLAMRAIEVMRERQRIIGDQILDDTERANYLAQQLQLPPVIAEALLANMISANVGFTNKLSQVMKGDQVAVDTAIREIARIMIETGGTLESAIRQAVTIRDGAKKKAQDLINKANDMSRKATERGLKYASISAIENAEARVKAVDQMEADFAADMQELLDIAGDMSYLEGADFTSVPGAQPMTMRDRAEQLKQQMEEAFQLYKETSEALLDLALARVEGDPVKEAEIAQQRADMAMRFARTQAERISAQAERIRADRQMQEALNEITLSQIDLLMANAEAAGNSVEVAELTIRRLKRQIEQARAAGAGEAEMNALRAEYNSAIAARRDARLDDRREYFQYLHDVEKITTGQLIGYLETLRAIPDLTEKQRRDLEVEIFNLRKELGQDFQFNLPTNLGLPTAYEVRRFNQSTGPGGVGGYNDNRTISVDVHVATGADPAQIANAVAAVVGEPNRNGTLGRRY